MTDIAAARRALLQRIVDPAGHSPPAQRRSAFDHAALSGALGALLDKVVRVRAPRERR